MKNNDYDSLLRRIKSDDVAFTYADLQLVVAQDTTTAASQTWLQSLRTMMLIVLTVMVGSEITASNRSTQQELVVIDHPRGEQAATDRYEAVGNDESRIRSTHREKLTTASVHAVQNVVVLDIDTIESTYQHSVDRIDYVIAELPTYTNQSEATAEVYAPFAFEQYNPPADQPRWIGLIGSYGRAEFSGIWKTVDDNCRCPTFRSLSGSTWATGLYAELPIDRSSIGAVSFVGSLSYQVISGSQTEIGESLPSISPDGSIEMSATQWRTEMDLSTIGVAAGLRLEVFEGLGFGAFLRADALVQSREQLQLQLVSPERARFDRSLAPDKTYSDDGRSIVFTDNSPIRDARPSVYWSFEPFVSWRVSLGPVALTPFASMRLPLTPFQRSSEGTVRLLQGGLTVTVPM